MDTHDAIEAAAAFPGSSLLAVHHDGWAHLTQSQEDLRPAFAALRLADRLLPLERGKTVAPPPRDQGL